MCWIILKVSSLWIVAVALPHQCTNLVADDSTPFQKGTGRPLDTIWQLLIVFFLKFQEGRKESFDFSIHAVVDQTIFQEVGQERRFDEKARVKWHD
mmetsp:Transcript_18482/g.32330  ORF Transcript_18482/g.32330 Transcript_18482/m.32330 type:complete len:96 (-) Transcript_18482:164-451(-)